MLRVDPSVITLTTGEVKAAEHRRRFRKHLERTTTFTGWGGKQVDGLQNIERGKASQSPATFGTAVKSEAGQFTTQDTDQRVLESVPPQSPRSPGDIIARVFATTSPAQERAQQRDDDYAEGSSPMPRLLGMTPRRLGPAVTFPATSPSHQFELGNHRPTEGVESMEPVVATGIASSATESPNLPLLFSGATHVDSVESTPPLPTGDRDELPSTQYDPVPRSIRAFRPATPARRSSLNPEFNIRSLDGESRQSTHQITPERTYAAEDVQPWVKAPNNTKNNSSHTSGTNQSNTEPTTGTSPSLR
ncbi:hypothetical protein DL546_003518 [Coniochaeta pulveracea]|uniref:Uncharacterized protein n=1 Tax=Coniochaeta pulveracea TaxID=177199 RepID=A0A420Y7I8_9PEZI|nr:hypothetical protein DL546_003518 [Coniochaeta pulveracea]